MMRSSDRGDRDLPWEHQTLLGYTRYDRIHRPRGHPRQSLATTNGVGKIGSVQLLEFVFGIKQVNMTRATGLKQIDDAFRLGREMRKSGETLGCLCLGCLGTGSGNCRLFGDN